MDVIPNNYEFIDKNCLKGGEGGTQAPALTQPYIVIQMLLTFAFHVFTCNNNETFGLGAE